MQLFDPYSIRGLHYYLICHSIREAGGHGSNMDNGLIRSYSIRAEPRPSIYRLPIPKNLFQSIQHILPHSLFFHTKSAAAKPQFPPHPCHSNLFAPVVAPSSPAQPALDSWAAVRRQTRVTPPAALQEISG